MCKYCERTDGDGMDWDWNGNLISEGDAIRINDIPLFGVDVFIRDYDENDKVYEDKRFLHVYIDGYEGMVFQKSVEINYCPMCGRKLIE